jgi:hypothetical protein
LSLTHKSTRTFPAWRRATLALAALLTLIGLGVWGPAPRTAIPAAADALNGLYLPLVTGGSGTAAPPPPQTSARIYWGALVKGQAPTAAALQSSGVFGRFETQSNKNMAILHWGQPWKMSGAYQPFQAAYFSNVRGHGSIPFIDWGAWALGGGTVQTDFQLADISAGVHDTYIRQWAAAAKAWGHPFFLRFNWEMNGNWQFPWSEQLNGNLPGDYVRAWRHVHDLFAEAGANNATWVWCPNVSGGTTRPLASVYPGDNYVDWTCLDGYNKYQTWLGMHSVFTGSGINWLYDSYAEILNVAPNKPIMIGETGSLEAGDGGAKKAAWLTDAFANQLPKNMPRIKAVVLFDWDDNSSALASLPIESSTQSIQAFKSAIASPYYAANEFANLNTSPIPGP